MHYAVIGECSHSRVLVVRVRARGKGRKRGREWGV